jgi:putative exosortase-associated protein (TIGR04073 family)
MKKACLILATVAIAATSLARWNPVTKLSRGISNLLYGFNEIPSQVIRTNRSEGSSELPYGLAQGVHKTIVRFGWGLYDVVSFPLPTFKGGYQAPFPTKQTMNPTLGYADFPPELGFNGGFRNNRVQNY